MSEFIVSEDMRCVFSGAYLDLEAMAEIVDMTNEKLSTVGLTESIKDVYSYVAYYVGNYQRPHGGSCRLCFLP